MNIFLAIVCLAIAIGLIVFAFQCDEWTKFEGDQLLEIPGFGNTALIAFNIILAIIYFILMKTGVFDVGMVGVFALVIAAIIIKVGFPGFITGLEAYVFLLIAVMLSFGEDSQIFSVIFSTPATVIAIIFGIILEIFVCVDEC